MLGSVPLLDQAAREAFVETVAAEAGRVAALLDSRDATLGPMSSSLRSADVAVVNLESALTRTGMPAMKEREVASNRYWFRSPPEALDLPKVTLDRLPPGLDAREIDEAVRSFTEQGGIWPVHCVQASDGAELHPALDREPIDAIIDKGQDPGTEGYSGFDGTMLADLLRELR